ncbi:hypothetical protein [Clostridium polynesiense]|uniref:hypothetical protein n=1 Tax=Clostridium polynesiense TaxID=1325933 RepID=UPI0005914DB8|nr:hypothetical protein [Clostridium polynesiense]
MNKRGTGVLFCAIGAFLYASGYIAPGILNSSYHTPRLTTPVIISVIVGILYLIWAEKSKEK